MRPNTKGKSKTKILITGATGFVGSEVLPLISNCYQDVCILVRDEKVQEIACQTAFSEFLVCGSSSKAIYQACNSFKPEVVIHIATLYGRSGETFSEIKYANYDMPLCILKAGLENDLKVFLNTDTFFDNNISLSPSLSKYVYWKKEFLERAKSISKKTEVNLVNLILYQVYGPNDRPEKFLPNLLKDLLSNKGAIEMTPGLQVRDFLHVRDVATAFLTVLTHSMDAKIKFNEYEIGTGVGTSIKEVAILIKKLNSSKTRLEFGALNYREGENMHSVADTEKIRALGWTSNINLEEGLLDL